MPLLDSALPWQCIGTSVRGAARESKDLPHQEAIQIDQSPAPYAPRILAISGAVAPDSQHGAIGARLAVEVAVGKLRELTYGEEYDNLSTFKRVAEEQLPRRLVQAWRNAVLHHSAAGSLAPPAAGQHVMPIYDATLLCVLVTEQFTLYMQLGAGDILCVNSLGQVHKPFAANQQAVGEAGSLGAPDAWQRTLVRLTPSYHIDTQLILVSSHGYRRSFTSDDEFLSIGPDYLDLLRTHGMHGLQELLENFLIETSAGGGGHAITLGIIASPQIAVEPPSSPDHLISEIYSSITDIPRLAEADPRPGSSIPNVQEPAPTRPSQSTPGTPPGPSGGEINPETMLEQALDKVLLTKVDRTELERVMDVARQEWAALEYRLLQALATKIDHADLERLVAPILERTDASNQSEHNHRASLVDHLRDELAQERAARLQEKAAFLSELASIRQDLAAMQPARQASLKNSEENSPPGAASPAPDLKPILLNPDHGPQPDWNDVVQDRIPGRADSEDDIW
jgi:hypothetical protein